MTASRMSGREGTGGLFIIIAISQVVMPLLLAGVGVLLHVTQKQIPQFCEVEPETARAVFWTFAAIGALCLPANVVLRVVVLGEARVKARLRSVVKVYQHYLGTYFFISVLCQVPAALALVAYLLFGGTAMQFTGLCVYAAALGVAFLPSRRRLHALMDAVAPPAEELR